MASAGKSSRALTMSARLAPGFLQLPPEDPGSHIRSNDDFRFIEARAEPLASKARGWIEDWLFADLILVRRSLPSLTSRVARS